jgi:23S rRNA pseudouridine1911/1915/1917 synthase
MQTFLSPFDSHNSGVMQHLGPEVPQVQRLCAVCESAAAGERLDRFLAGKFPALSRSRIQALIAAGHARCNGKILQDASAPVRSGFAYTLEIPPPVSAKPAAETIPLQILYEDADLIVLDKPAGLVVHPAPGNPDGTLVNALLAHCGAEFAGIGGEKRPGIVHRLDKDTSGVMVVAKTELAHAALSRAFAERRLRRAYWALCWGIPNPAEGVLFGLIGRDPRDRKRMAVLRAGGKPAETRYRTERVWHGSVAALECRLATGRTHQIRVQMAHAGHPIIGDPVYLKRIPAAARSLPEPLRRQLLDFPRQALHAMELGFAHPRSGAPLFFRTELPDDLRTLCAVLEGTEPKPGRAFP